MTDSEEPKIIVDEDWKSQVEKEKEELRKQETNAPADVSKAADDAMPQIPEASFQVLLATLATQAMAMMGLLPNMDGSGNTEANLPMARHLIDMISVVEEKTKGNLTDDEAATLTENLHQLRMAFVAVSQQAGSSAAPGTDSSSPSSIELP